MTPTSPPSIGSGRSRSRVGSAITDRLISARVPRARHAFVDRPDGQPGAAVRRPQPVLRVGRAPTSRRWGACACRELQGSRALLARPMLGEQPVVVRARRQDRRLGARELGIGGQEWGQPMLCRAPRGEDLCDRDHPGGLARCPRRRQPPRRRGGRQRLQPRDSHGSRHPGFRRVWCPGDGRAVTDIRGDAHVSPSEWTPVPAHPRCAGTMTRPADVDREGGPTAARVSPPSFIGECAVASGRSHDGSSCVGAIRVSARSQAPQRPPVASCPSLHS